MARRKQEIALQVELETQEDWEEAVNKEGLLIIDVYQEWAGPCVGMVGNFRKIKNEIGDDLLKFAVAKADTIDSLELYRGKCEPCFLLYASGSLVYHVAGANAPVLSKIIPEQLAYEHKVLAGDAERKAIRDPMFENQPEKAEADVEESEKDEIEVEKEITVCLIKPDAVEAGKVEEILEQLEAHGMEVLKQEVRQLTEEEARSFYAKQEQEEYFEELVKFMCSGPSHILVLSETNGVDTISKFRDLIGPKKVEEAKETAPESLRAQFGTSSMTNALHGSDNKDNAMNELAFFFPDYVVPTSKKVMPQKSKVQRTLALIRPDALREHKDEILAKIEESGFQIAFQKEVQLTKEQAMEFYKEHEGEEYFEELTNRMSSGPLLALALARQDAVKGWRSLLGPKEVPKAKEEAPESLRAQYSTDETINPLHGSDSVTKAEQELNFFFPIEQTVAVVKPDAYQTKDEIIKRIHEAGFRIAARKETQLTKEIAAQMYDENKEKEYFGALTEHMSNGQTLFLVLSREDAVEGWRSLIGPTDPAVAKEEAPNSIRAALGEDVTKNAVHGSSNSFHAKKEMQLVFGDMEFNEDGTVKGQEPDLDAAVIEREEPSDEAVDSGDQVPGDALDETRSLAESVDAEQQTDEQEAEADMADDAELETRSQAESVDAEQQTDEQDAEADTTGESKETAGESKETAAENAENADDNPDAPAEEKAEESSEPSAENPEAHTEQKADDEPTSQ